MPDKNQTVKGSFEPSNKTRQVYKKLITHTTIIIFCGVLLGFLAPFGMHEITLVYSISYWIFTCLCGYLIYLPVIYLGERCLSPFISVYWSRVAISTFVASIIMSFVVPIISWLFFAIAINLAEQFWIMFPKALIIGGVITLIAILQVYTKKQKQELETQKQLNEEQSTQVKNVSEQQFNKFMQMIPLEKRGKLYCLEMSDHYVKVYTEKGHHLLLMRFKDALDLLSEYPGFRTHRSWWVAKDMISSVKKDGRKLSLSMNNGLDVPVSRTYYESLKEANIY